MTGFNPLLIISRITSSVVSTVNIQNNASSSAQNASANLNTGFNTFSSNLQSGGQNSANSLYFEKTPLILTPTESLKLTTIEVDKKAQYIRTLLNLPENFEDFYDELTYSTASKNFQNAEESKGRMLRVMQGGKIDISMLSSLLKENSNKAAQKLLMLISNVSKYGASDISGLKEIMSLLNSQTAFLSSENQALKTLILLYLPWLPLAERCEDNLDFTIDIFDKIEGPDPNSEESVEEVKILIETKNFSNVTVILTLNPLGQVDIDVIADKNFPHKKVMELIKEATISKNIKTNISSSAFKKAGAGENTGYDSNNVKITASGSISPKMMLMAQSLIKIIIEVDYQESIIINNNDDNQKSDKN